jgi:hypothetical protein
MSLVKSNCEYPEGEFRLFLDARKRINLTKLLPSMDVSSFKAYADNGKIILEPMAEIPAHELWLHQNPKTLSKVKKSLKKKGKHYLGSFAKYAEESDDV